MSRRLEALTPEFVELMPDELQPGILYVSVRFKSIQHLCCCGCGRKVVTPLSPTSWSMEYDGRSVSLRPSIGNWQKDCKSHYFIIENRVHWARGWSEEEIALGLRHDVESKVDYYADRTLEPREDAKPQTPTRQKWSIRERLRELARKLF